MTILDCFEAAARLAGFPEDEIIRRRKNNFAVLPFAEMMKPVPDNETEGQIKKFYRMIKDVEKVPAEQRIAEADALVRIVKKMDGGN